MRKWESTLKYDETKKNKNVNKLESDSSDDEENWEDSGDSLDDTDSFAEESDNSEVSKDGFFQTYNSKVKDFVVV